MGMETALPNLQRPIQSDGKLNVGQNLATSKAKYSTFAKCSKPF